MPELFQITSPDIPPGQRFSSIGKTIHNIGKKGKKLHQQSIHCENSIALTCTGRSEKSSDGD